MVIYKYLLPGQKSKEKMSDEYYVITAAFELLNLIWKVHWKLIATIGYIT